MWWLSVICHRHGRTFCSGVLQAGLDGLAAIPLPTGDLGEGDGKESICSGLRKLQTVVLYNAAIAGAEDSDKDIRRIVDYAKSLIWVDTTNGDVDMTAFQRYVTGVENFMERSRESATASVRLLLSAGSSGLPSSGTGDAASHEEDRDASLDDRSQVVIKQLKKKFGRCKDSEC